MRQRDDEALLDKVEHFRARRRLSGLDARLLDEVIDVIAHEGRDPAEYVADLFEEHQVVFIGEHAPSGQAGAFLQELIPALQAAGVWCLGIEFACVDDQAVLDALLRAPRFDETLARSAVFRWGLRHHFAYREYIDVLRAAWAVNQTKDPLAPMFRIVALDYDIDVDAVTETADLRSPFAWDHLRPRGTAARHMAEVVMREFVERGHRALVLTRTAHALTRLRRAPHHVYDAFDSELVDSRVVGAANHVYAAIADRAATVLIHQPLPADGELGDYTLAADGVLDAAFARPNGPKYPVAFDVRSGVLGQLSCNTSADGGDLSSRAQGWIFLDTIDRLTAPTPLGEVVDDATIEEARRFSLDPSLRQAESTPADFDAAVVASAAAAELGWTQII
jgi:hypothetical protein